MIAMGKHQGRERFMGRSAAPPRKGYSQIDYIVAVSIFIIVFALVIQYVSNYFSDVGDRTKIGVMTSEATSLLDIIERGYEPQQWPQTAPSATIVLLLYMDNSSLDSSWYGNNGTISGANCSASAFGRLNTGCSFDGIDDSIGVDDKVNINFTTSMSFSVAAWVYPQTLAGDSSTVVSRQNGVSAAGWRLFLNTTSRELMFILSDGTNSVTVTSYSNVTNASWSHVAAVVDRASNSSALYLNGLAVNTSANISAVGDVRNSQPLRIGASGAGHYFNGSLDEIVVYNKTLTPAEAYNLFAYENNLDRIGISTKAYRMYVIVNNTQPFWYDQGNARHIASELVRVNYTDFGFSPDVASSFLIDDTNAPANYQISGNTITFSTTINPNDDKIFTLYFDDDSKFAERTASTTGTDNLTEMRTRPQEIQIVQWKKILALNSSNYTRVKNSTGIPNEFSIVLIDRGTNATILNFGPPPPPSGNIVAFRRFTTFQNSTGAIRRGDLRVRVW